MNRKFKIRTMSTYPARDFALALAIPSSEWPPNFVKARHASAGLSTRRAKPTTEPRRLLPPGRPEEFHHQPPTEPCVNLSAYTARISHSFATSRLQNDTESRMLLPVSRLAITSFELIHPLCSPLITRDSSLLRDDPPPSRASVLSPFVVYTYKVFP